MNLLENEAAHQRSKYLKYKNLNKPFAKKKTVIIDDTLDSYSSSSSEDHNSCDEDELSSTAYDSESAKND